MVALYRLKGLGWLASCAVVAIGFYLVSSQVAAERKRLEQVDRRILTARRDIRALETEFDVRANLAQLERWNGDTLALTAPTARQFVRDEGTLAALSPAVIGPAGASEVQLASLIVPSTPVIAAPAVTAPAPGAGIVQVAAVKAVATPRYDAVAVSRPAAPIVKVAAAKDAAPAGRARVIRAVAMVDRSLLSAGTLGELMHSARAEGSRLR